MQPHGRASDTFRRWPSTTTGTPESTKASEIGDVLRDAGAPVGDGLRGPAARTYVLVSAKDGYSAVFALGEIETSEARCAPLLADARDRSPLPPHVGPVQVVAPCDRTHARWVRAITELTIVVAGTSAPAASER